MRAPDRRWACAVLIAVPAVSFVVFAQSPPVAVAAGAAEGDPLEPVRAALCAGDLDGARQILVAPAVAAAAGAPALGALIDQVRHEAPRLRAIYELAGKGAAAVEVGGLRERVRGERCLVVETWRLAAELDAVEAAAEAQRKRDWPEAERRFAALAAHPGRFIDARAASQHQETARAEQRFLHRLRATLAPGSDVVFDLARLLATLVAAAALLGLWRRLAWPLLLRARRPRYDLVLSRGHSDAANPELACRLVDELRLLSWTREGERPAGDQPSEFGELLATTAAEPGLGLAQLGSLVDGGAELRLGVLRVPLRSLWTFLANLATPARYRWTGRLIEANGVRLLSVTQRDRLDRARTVEWSSFARNADEEPPEAVLRDVAFQIAVHGVKDPPTRSARAYIAWRDALRLLDTLFEAPERDKLLRQARQLLQQAIAADPRMWRARLRLGVVLRKLGERDQARLVFDAVRREVLPEETRRELRYQEAVLHAQERGRAGLLRAHALLTELLDGLPARPVSVLLLNARSLRGAVAAQLLGKEPARPTAWADRAAPGPSPGELEALVEGECGFFSAPPPEGAEGRAFTVAAAFLFYAVGRERIERGDLTGGIEAVSRVVTTVPELPAAWAELGRAYRKSAAIRPDWFEHAAHALESGLAINPDEPLANYEYGRALAAQRPPRVDEAITHLTRASARLAAASYYLGELLATERHDLAGATARMWDAVVRRDERAPFAWAERIVEVVAEAPAAARTEEMVARARRAAAWLQEQRARLERRRDGEASPEERRGLDEALGGLQLRLDRVVARLGPLTPAPSAATAGRD